MFDELDLDTIFIPQEDAHLLDFAVDDVFHNVGSMAVDGGEILLGVPLVVLDLHKADGVCVKIGATEEVVSWHKQQCLGIVHDLFTCYTRRLAFKLFTLLGRSSAKEITTDLLNVLGGRVRRKISHGDRLVVCVVAIEKKSKRR